LVLQNPQQHFFDCILSQLLASRTTSGQSSPKRTLFKQHHHGMLSSFVVVQFPYWFARRVAHRGRCRSILVAIQRIFLSFLSRASSHSIFVLVCSPTRTTASPPPPSPKTPKRSTPAARTVPPTRSTLVTRTSPRVKCQTKTWATPPGPKSATLAACTRPKNGAGSLSASAPLSFSSTFSSLAWTCSETEPRF